jgi:hypothetical protein
MKEYAGSFRLCALLREPSCPSWFARLSFLGGQ